MVSVVILLLATSTHRRNQDWKSEIAFWSDNILKQPTAPRGYFNLAVANARQGEFGKALDLLDETISIEPNLQAAHVQRGQILGLHGQYELAIESFNQAIGIPAASLRGTNVIGDAFSGERGSVQQNRSVWEIARGLV